MKTPPFIAEREIGRLLVVDDEPIMRQMLDLVLTQEGWIVDHAASGDEALDACESEAYDVVVLDHLMPGMTGMDAARRLAAEGYGASLVMFSACLTPELVEECESLGIVPIDKLNWNELVAHCRLLDVLRRRPVAWSLAVASR